MLRLTQAAAALQVGHCEQAAEVAKSVLAEDSRHLGALEIFAKALWRAGKCDELVPVADRLIALNPYEPGYHALRGGALQSLGRYGEATDAFSRSEELPGCKSALRELEAWQAGLVSEMLERDPVFRAGYAQNPARACESRGFRFTMPQVQVWESANAEATWTYARPS